MSTLAAEPEAGATPVPVEAQRSFLREHAPFLVTVLVGVALRILVSVAFTPALVFSDGPLYLHFIDTLQPSKDRPAGYGLLVLYPMSWLTDSVAAVAVVQHLLGLFTAVVLYTLLRRWGVNRWVATLGAVPVLLDALQLLLEHSTHSDTLFELLVVLAVAVLGWRRRPTTATALIGGLLLGVAATVRLTGEPLFLAGLGFCLLSANGWRRKVAMAVVVVVAFLVPVGAYATWYEQEHGVFALAQFSGKSLYLRTTTFVNCATISVPRYQQVLCPREPLGQRLEPTYYVWHDPRTLRSLRPPPGISRDEAMHEFAVAAIRSQPLDYAMIVLRDFALNFDIERKDRLELDTAEKWQFSRYLDFVGTKRTVRAYLQHGGDRLTPHQPYADMLVIYQKVGILFGPLLLGCLVLGLLGGFGVGRARNSGMRSMCLLLTVTGTGLMLVPDVAAEFVWRYQLPALALLPAGAALGYTALRGGRREPDHDQGPDDQGLDDQGQCATASTD